MFCQQCGNAMAALATACPSCNTQVRPAAAAGTGLSGPISATGRRAQSLAGAWKAAIRTLRSIAPDPVGRLQGAFAALGEVEGLRVGLVLGGLSCVCLLLGGYWIFPFRDEIFEFLGFGGVLKALAFAALPFLTAVAGSLAGRKLGGAGGSLAGDCFVAGAALVPLSLAMLIDGLLGFENASAMLALAVFGGCASTLMLFAGYTRVGGISERAATLWIPLVVMLALWLGKSLASSILGGGFGGGDFGGGGFGGPGPFGF
jgi:hypothetical protein